MAHKVKPPDPREVALAVGVILWLAIYGMTGHLFTATLSATLLGASAGLYTWLHYWD